MSAAKEILAPWVEATRTRVSALAGGSPKWLGPIRESAAEEFSRLGFPTRKDEEWKYTRVKPIAEGPFQVPLLEATVAVDLAPYLSEAFSGARMVFIDGLYRADLSDLEGIPEGLTVEPISAALARGADGLEDTLGENPEGQHPFRALNTACFADGVYLHAAAGVEETRPLHILCLGGVGGTGASHLRHRFVIERGARVSVIEEYRGEAETFTNVVTDVSVAEEARLDRVKIAGEDPRAHHVSYLNVVQAGHSVFHDLFFALGGDVTRNEIEVLLDGEEVESTLNGLYHIDGSRQTDNHTLLRHAKPNCRSWELYRGILDGKSRGIFSGKIHVYEDAQKTDAKQNSNSLLLSRDAEADTRPRLEIHADDVRCTHGATVGELDSTALFYLRSRGISRDEAQRMLVHAFAGEVLASVEDEGVRTELTLRLQESLKR